MALIHLAVSSNCERGINRSRSTHSRILRSKRFMCLCRSVCPRSRIEEVRSKPVCSFCVGGHRLTQTGRDDLRPWRSNFILYACQFAVSYRTTDADLCDCCMPVKSVCNGSPLDTYTQGVDGVFSHVCRFKALLSIHYYLCFIKNGLVVL